MQRSLSRGLLRSSRPSRRCRVPAVTSQPHPFDWELLEDEPKVRRSCLARTYRTTEYETLHTGGFLRLCTERGRVYWLAQNMEEHRTPDWKLHFSVRPKDIPRAWNVLSRVFVAHGCDFGMKAVASEALDAWPPKQRGRELTVYIFQDDPAYSGGGPMMGCCATGSEHRYWLGPEFEREPEFWESFLGSAEEALKDAGLESHGGTADGDLPLGRFASLRNEAYILGWDEGSESCTPAFVYPPNAAGWNAAGHPLPLRVHWLHRLRAAIVAARFRGQILGAEFLSARCARRRV